MGLCLETSPMKVKSRGNWREDDSTEYEKNKKITMNNAYSLAPVLNKSQRS